MLNVLTVEDDKAISNLICSNLKSEGYLCDYAYDGEVAINMIDKNKYDLILLDIMLPNINGYEVMEYIRYLDIPVIFISAKSQVKDRIKGLKLGADDYIVKPFQVGELLARIESVLRRTNKFQKNICIDDVEVDLDSHIQRLRKKLDWNEKIKTVFRIGYRLEV